MPEHPSMPGLRVEIPGRRVMSLRYLVLDFNGTLAADGKLLLGVTIRLRALGRRFSVMVLTADTHGTAQRELQALPLTLKHVKTAADKFKALAPEAWRSAVAIGNGVNDLAMLRACRLGVAVLGPEGVASRALRAADIVVSDIRDALDLLEHPLRLIATLRK